MPQVLPFKESFVNSVSPMTISKEKHEKNPDIKDEGNPNELLKYLMKDNQDSMGHEISQNYSGFLHDFISNSENLPENSSEKKKKNSFECEEGFLLGKLRVFKDKTAKMVFGGVEFEILNGINSNFCQELVGIDYFEKSAKPKAYFLTNIQKKFICKPKIENLFE